MLRSALVRLTLAYLAILMAISFAFSVAVYQVSVDALDESLRLQARAITEQPRFRLLPRTYDLTPLIEEQLDEGRRRITFNLIGANLVVLLIGGAGSYWLAGRTLRPIEAALEAQTRFVADASHELRTPLAAMKAETEVALRDKKLTLSEARTLLESNLEETEKLHQLANGLLTLSRYQTGEHIPMEELSMRAVVKEASDRLSGALAGASLHVGGDAALVGDRESLVSLVMILLDNGLKYSQDKPELKVEIKQQGRKAVITVRDKGQGIKAADLPYIFDRFYRGDSSRSKATDGYGLGLSIAQQIAEMHHGLVSAKSRPKQGTTMTIVLPLAQPKKSFPV